MHITVKKKELIASFASICLIITYIDHYEHVMFLTTIGKKIHILSVMIDTESGAADSICQHLWILLGVYICLTRQHVSIDSPILFNSPHSSLLSFSSVA